MASSRQARIYRIEGRVQGVGFRWFVERAADELGVAGYVKNLYDGSVEVYAIGSEEQLDTLRQQLYRGPGTARITQVIENPAPVRPDHGFRVEY